MIARKQKKHSFQILENKYMPYKLFEFQEHLMNGAFLIKLTQFEKTRSISIFLIPLENLYN